VVFAYNISVNETTGYSPFYLASGRHPGLPIEVLAGLRPATVKHKGANFVEKMTKALNEAYGMVRERQLRTLERNQKYQLGLTSKATQQEVEKALARRPIPGFGVGELVSYWQPEIVDKDITHVMPKKFQYRWNGPYPVLERENDHFYVEIKGVRTLVNPGRLRKYITWVSDPWESEGTGLIQPGRQLDCGEPEVGDLIAVALTTGRNNSRPFAIGRVIGLNDDESYSIHWFGNAKNQLEGTYRPEWRVCENGKDTKVYHSQVQHGEEGAVAHTSGRAGQVIRRSNILHFGFQLVYNDRLPVDLKRKMHANDKIAWAIPKE
jgi:hypothetical protein